MYITFSFIWKFIVLSFSIFYFWIYKYRSISFIFVESIRCRTLRISVIVRKWRKHMNKWEKSVLQRCCVLPNWSGGEYILTWKQQNINPNGNCVGSRDDWTSATLFVAEVIAVPDFTGFQDTVASALDEASVDQTELISILILQLLKVHVANIKNTLA